MTPESIADSRGRVRVRRAPDGASYDDRQLGTAPPTTAALDPGLPRLDEHALTGHPFRCRVFGCCRLLVWLDGYCDAHRTRWSTVPVAIYGREREGWCEWPEPLVAYLLRSGGHADAR